MAFENTRAIRAVKDGLVYSMPLIIVGAVYLLLFQLPVQSLADAVEATGIVPALRQGYTSSFQIVSLIAALGIAYQWAKNEGWEPLSAGIIAIALFLIMVPSSVAGEYFTIDAETGEYVAATVAGLDKTWLAGQGMIAAIIAGLLTGLIYSWFLKKDIRIKMPEGVPDGVAAAFTGLIPAATILSCGVVVYHICTLLAGVTPVELIYEFLQAPLQNLGDSFGGVLVIEGLIPFLWWFGVHGATVVASVANPIADSNTLMNQQIYEGLIAQGMTRAEAMANTWVPAAPTSSPTPGAPASMPSPAPASPSSWCSSPSPPSSSRSAGWAWAAASSTSTSRSCSAPPSS